MRASTQLRTAYPSRSVSNRSGFTPRSLSSVPLPGRTTVLKQSLDGVDHYGLLRDIDKPRVEPHQLPRHLAVIMDGNYRWAQQRKLAWTSGHEAGVSVLKDVVAACREWGIQALTVYAFSSENWSRSQAEVAFLMALLETSLRREVDALHEQGVRLSFAWAGADSEQRLGPSLRAQMARASELTQHNTALHLTVALSYGGRQDIVAAVQRLARMVQQHQLQPDQIDEAVLEQQLSTHSVLSEVGPPDLLIRTSGEQRLSNFMLWELAYTELYFTDVHWPDFNRHILREALESYAQRTRRYGCRLL